MATELSNKERAFVDTYFKDVATPPVKMLIQACSLMLAALVLIVVAIIYVSDDFTVRMFKLIMLPGLVFSTALFIPGFVIYRKWFRSRDLAKLHAIFQKLTGTAAESPAE